MRFLIRLGDPTDHGGVVVSASPATLVEGKPVARIGDLVACPIPGHGVCKIVTGDPSTVVDGSPVARQGDKTACGATLIPTQFSTAEL
ncbi:PAAR domain-containing protein [Azovibrio restrictus]|uniref:PAAR domain-containing protein n=1 Tax=Azovibrio restrictus TaxID=146938 RepID=UPI00041446F0|nr:PAAR domain-containing protein [Azovibrio restrictus]MDD3484215.1 PAAR domain-containing protein [Azovibrio restrictus]